MLTRILDAAALGLAAASLLGFLGRLFWIFDLFAHFKVQYFQICLVLIFIALWCRLYTRAVALVLLASLNYAFVLPLYFGKPVAQETRPVRAMLMNINAGNGNTEEVLTTIRQYVPDLLLLEEVTPAWAENLAVLNQNYPYRIAEPQAGFFGISFFSKYPLEHRAITRIGSSGVPSIITEIHLPAGVVSFIGTHPVPPVGAAGSRMRNHQLIELPAVVKEQHYPVMVIGDLNVTPFSYWFRRVISESGLKNSMKGFGFQPSWPAYMPFMRIPIDHVLHDESIVIHNRMTGGDVGSDHLPVIVDFSLGKTAQ